MLKNWGQNLGLRVQSVNRKPGNEERLLQLHSIPANLVILSKSSSISGFFTALNLAFRRVVFLYDPLCIDFCCSARMGWALR